MLELIRGKRTIREYKPTPIPEELVLQLIEAALRSPTSRNRLPWSFIVVDDLELLQALSSCKPHGASPLERAPLAIVVCADAQLTDVWIEDCSIATHQIMLVAESLGLGSCWIQVRLRDHSDELSSEVYIKQLLKLPDSYVVESVIAIGYPAETKPGLDKSLLLRERVYRNRFAELF